MLRCQVAFCVRPAWALHLRVQVPLRAGHNERNEAQLHVVVQPPPAAEAYRLQVASLFDGQLIVDAMRALDGSCGAERSVDLRLTSHHTR